jgi:putative transcriptional regulator
MSVKVLLQEVRKSKGLSQNELARLTNMSPQNIQKIEQGEAKSLTFKTLSRFCQVLQCQPGDLLIYENQPEAVVQVSVKGNRNKLTQDTKLKKITKEKDLFSLEADKLFPQTLAPII